jgi:hypothetical protein
MIVSSCANTVGLWLKNSDDLGNTVGWRLKPAVLSKLTLSVGSSSRLCWSSYHYRLMALAGCVGEDNTTGLTFKPTVPSLLLVIALNHCRFLARTGSDMWPPTHCRFQPQTGSDIDLHCRFWPTTNYFLILKLKTGGEERSLQVCLNPTGMPDSAVASLGPGHSRFPSRFISQE